MLKHSCLESARGRFGRGGISFGSMTMALLIGAAVAFGASSACASDPIGIYALVDKVVLEPNEQTPERVQVWGAFCLAQGGGDDYGPAKRGYLYYKLDPEKPEVARKEWSDLKGIAGTQQIVAFGSRRKDKGEIRQADDKAKAADVYPIGFGLQKIRENHWNAGPVKTLRALAGKNTSDAQQERQIEVAKLVDCRAQPRVPGE